MSRKFRVGIVCGYGTQLDDTYKEHLDAVAKDADKLDFILVSGGFTNPKNKKLSEATVMKRYLLKRNPSLVVFREEQALNSIGNLRYSKSVLLTLFPNLNAKLEVTIYCKRPWWLKVKLLSLFLMKPFNKVSVRATSRASSWKEYVKQCVFAIIFDFLSLLFPKLQSWKLRRKGLNFLFL